MKSVNKELSSSGMLVASQVFNNHVLLLATTMIFVKREKIPNAVLRCSCCWWSWLHLLRGLALPLLPPSPDSTSVFALLSTQTWSHLQYCDICSSSQLVTHRTHPPDNSQHSTYHLIQHPAELPSLPPRPPWPSVFSSSPEDFLDVNQLSFLLASWE